MTKTQKREYLYQVMNMGTLERKEDGICSVSDLSDVPDGFRGIVYHVNDHGNCSILRHFANGNYRLIADCV